MSLQTEIRSWDSAFFGFGVAHIHGSGNLAELVRTLHTLRSGQVRLACWITETDPDPEISKKFHDTFHQVRIVFCRDIEQGIRMSSTIPVEEYSGPADVLRDLAEEAGAFSRFHLDKRIPEEKFRTLYYQWIQNSFGGSMGDLVLVVRMAGIVAGLVTLRYSDKEAEIGLLSVDPAMRNKGLGRALCEAAVQYAAMEGKQRISVVTQEENNAACTLYAACGFAVCASEKIIHFWL